MEQDIKTQLLTKTDRFTISGSSPNFGINSFPFLDLLFLYAASN